uniref:Histone H1.8 n=1 Tax=Canis lupus familiaris TaxID=9615 RepID=A0A8C0NY46_CANLF
MAPGSIASSDISTSSTSSTSTEGSSVVSGSEKPGPSRGVGRVGRRHPPVLRMVLEALQAGEQRRGTSVAAIKVYILQKYPTVDVIRLKYLLKQALATGMHRGLLVRPTNSKAKGATGSFKVSLLGLDSGAGGGQGGRDWAPEWEPPSRLLPGPWVLAPAQRLFFPHLLSLSSLCLLGDALSSRELSGVPRLRPCRGQFPGCAHFHPCHVCSVTRDCVQCAHFWVPSAHSSSLELFTTDKAHPTRRSRRSQLGLHLRALWLQTPGLQTRAGTSQSHNILPFPRGGSRKGGIQGHLELRADWAQN